MKNYKRKISYKFVYVIFDILVTFAFSIVTFLSYYKPVNFVVGLNWVYCLIFSGSLSLVTALVFYIFHIYRIFTREIGIFECLRMMTIAFILQIVGLVVISGVPQLPRFTDFIFSWILSATAVTFMYPTIRILVRVFNIASIVRKKVHTVKTIVIGAGATGKVVVDESRRNKDNHNQIIMFVDDDPNKIGGTFSNVPVKGPISEISKIIDFTGAQEVIIAMSKISKERLHEVLALLNMI